MKIAKTKSWAKIPTRNHDTDAGLDLYASENCCLEAYETRVVSTGIAIEFPPDTMGLIKPKSSQQYLIGAGVVDQDYRGEIKVLIFNSSRHRIEINQYDAIAQLVVLPVIVPPLEVVSYSELKQTERGASGGINKLN